MMDVDFFWEKLKSGIREGSVASAEKFDLYSKIGKLKIESFTLKKKIEKSYTDLGMRVYDLKKQSENDFTDDLSVESFVRAIDQHQKNLNDLVTQIEKIKTESESKTGGEKS